MERLTYKQVEKARKAIIDGNFPAANWETFGQAVTEVLLAVLTVGCLILLGSVILGLN